MAAAALRRTLNPDCYFDDTAADPAAMAKERAEEASYIKRACLPIRHLKTAVVKHPGWSKALAVVSEKIGNGVIIALIGPRGTGKTQIAVEVAKAKTKAFVRQDRFRPDKFALYSTAMGFFIALRQSYDPKATTREGDALKSFLTPRLLILDEIQVRSGSEWEANMLTTMIDARYSGVKDTILIGNLTPETLGKAVGDSVMDRMNEGGGVLVMDWDSMRGA